MGNYKSILEYVEIENSGTDKLKIRCRKTKNGYSVYLDNDDRKSRKTERVDKSLYFNGTKESLNSDKEKLRRIVAYRNQKQEKSGNELGESASKKTNTDFIQFFKENSNSSYNSTFSKLLKFVKNDKLLFKKIDKQFCIRFSEFLQKEIAPNTAKSYFHFFNAMLNKAVYKEIIDKNPALNVRITAHDPERNFLTQEEIILLLKTEKTHIDVCNGFLFSCFTGLRYSDVSKLKFQDLEDGYIAYQQKKTKQYERVKLNENALKIVKEQKDFYRSEYIFNMPHLATVESYLKKWVEKAGIKKHITFHCARHSFATIALTYDIDIYTVSKLLGHRDIKTTQIYAKIIDKRKDSAIDKLPVFDF
jgi:integrase